MFTQTQVASLSANMIVTFDVHEHLNGVEDDTAWHAIKRIDWDGDIATITMRSLQGSFRMWSSEFTSYDECFTRDDFENFDV